MRKRLKLLKKRENPEFEKFFKEHATLDETGKITVRDCYAHLGFNINWNGQLISTSYAGAVWFLTHGRWQKSGYHIDHIDDNPMNNRPDNLQELTEAENQFKRRGKKVYRSYGRGKYGYGMYIHDDKRDGYFYISRNIYRGFGNGDLKGIKIALGRESSLVKAEKRVEFYIDEIKIKGVDYIPPSVERRPRKDTQKIDALTEKMRKMREEGMTIQAIADKIGLNIGSVYNRIKFIVPKI